MLLHAPYLNELQHELKFSMDNDLNLGLFLTQRNYMTSEDLKYIIKDIIGDLLKLL